MSKRYEEIARLLDGIENPEDLTPAERSKHYDDLTWFLTKEFTKACEEESN